MHTVDVTLDDAIDTYMCLFPTISENFKELSDEVTKLENRLNTLDEIAYKHIENIKSMIEKADDIDEEESMNEKNDDNGDGIPNPQKVTFLKRIANKISSMTEKIANAISRHPFNSYNAINTTIHAHKQANDMAMQAHKQATDAAMHAHKQANDMAMQAQTQANNMAMQAHMQATGMMW
jgi:cell division septum initiation protein DivIVA